MLYEHFISVFVQELFENLKLTVHDSGLIRELLVFLDHVLLAFNGPEQL